MEHPCHQCGAAVEDGVPFCQNCGAPQIRVANVPPAPLAPPAPGPSLPPGTPENMQPPAQPVPLPAAPLSVDWRLGLSAAVIAGLAAGFASALPILGVGCCLWMLAGGALAVSIYVRRAPVQLVSKGMGARIGALTGVVGYFTYALLMGVEVVVFHQGGRLREQLRRSVEQSAAGNPDPQAQAMVQWMTSPAGLATLVTVSMLLFFIAFLLFCSAGGALGASLFGKRSQD